MVNWNDPETFKLSDEAYNRYRNNDTHLHNSVARENPEQSFLSALAENKESYEKLTIDGKPIGQFIGDL